MPKKTESVEPLGVFNIHIVAKHQKYQGEGLGGTFLFPEKSLTMPKKTERGDPLVSPGMVCYAGKQEKRFLVQFARPNSATWCNNIL